MIRMREFGGRSVPGYDYTQRTVKRLKMSELKNNRNVGIRALSLDEGDELISVRETMAIS